MDSALIAVFPEERGAAADVEEGESAQEEREDDEDGVRHRHVPRDRRGRGRSEPVSRLAAVDVGEEQDEACGQSDEERHEATSFHAGEGASASLKKSGRRWKETLRRRPASRRCPKRLKKA
mgnify:CR=1 FL=1